MKSKFIRCASCLAALLSFAATAGEPAPGPMKTKPIWELKAPVEITGGAPVEIPHTASLDAGKFTMRMEFALPEVKEGAKRVRKRIKVLSQEVGETGWSIGFYQTGGNTCQFEVFVNGHNYGLGFLPLPVEGKPKKLDYYTMTLVSRGEGVVSIYLNPECWWGKRHHCETTICPNLEPIKIGWADPDYLKRTGCVPMDGIKIRSLAFYGPEEDWYPKGEEKKIPALTRAGKGWAITIPGGMTDPKRPRILCYGDSIYWGYGYQLAKRLEGSAYVCGWMNFVESLKVPEERKEAIAEAAASEKFDWIFFNNGLHFYYWEKGWTEERVREHYRDLVRSFRKGAPQAKIVLVATTPQIGPAPKGEKATTLHKDDERSVFMNRMAAEVAKEMGCVYLDVYTPLAAHLELANGGGDKYHWTGEGYKVIADAIIKEVFPDGLEQKKGDK